MLENLKREANSFLNDLEKNIKDPKELRFLKTRSIEFINIVLDEIEKIMDYKEDRLNAIIRKQEQNDKSVQELQEKIDMMYQDIYEEESADFAIICPYCNYEFDAQIDENFNEIKCPECGNTIELDWNGNPDDDQGTGCSGNCSNCGGCE